LLRILICDEQAMRAAQMAAILAASGYPVRVEAERSLSSLSLTECDLVIAGGETLLHNLSSREAATPQIMVLTSEPTLQAVVHLLELGVDDYLSSPYTPGVLLARVALAAYRAGIGATSSQQDTIQLKRGSRIATRRGIDIALTPNESTLVSTLMERKGRPTTIQMLRKAIWGSADKGSIKGLGALIRSLRLKLEPKPDVPCFICTEPGIGYRWLPPGA
jgi:two-component system KDP operon response regulator KdpE